MTLALAFTAEEAKKPMEKKVAEKPAAMAPVATQADLRPRLKKRPRP